MKKKINIKALIGTIITFIGFCCLVGISIFDTRLLCQIIGILIIIALLVAIFWLIYLLFADFIFEEE